MSDTIYCPMCGTQNGKSAKYCVACGATLQDRTAPEQTYVEPNSNVAAPSPQATVMPSQPQPTIANNVAVQSPPSNVSFADDGTRFIAFIIDSIILGIFTSILGYHGEFNMMMMTDYSSRALDVFISFGYFWLLEAFNRGQTLGKMIMKIRTVDERSKGPINPGQALLHILGKVFFLPLDIIIAWFVGKNTPEEKSQVRVSQRISKTVVIRA